MNMDFSTSRILTGLLASTALCAYLSMPAHAQEDAGDANDESTLQETIIVTGTRTASRTALETAVPVDAFPIGELTGTGRVELNQILASTVPSFNFNQTAINDGTDIIRPATLRGLSPDQTLVLLNSKRRHSSALVNINGSVGRGSSAVDLNTIPTSAIGSVQVLRDGASAQYGSDAIAGVINVLLREADSGGGMTLRYGAYATEPEGLNRTDYDGETLTVGGWAGFKLGNDGFVTVSTEFSDRDVSNRAGLDPRAQYIEPTGELDSRNLTFDRLNHRYGNGNAENLSFFVNGGMNLSDTWELYFTAGYQDREGDSAGYYRRSSDSAPSPLGSRSTPRNLTEIYPDGFLPLIIGEVADYTLSGGLEGELRGWNSDFSFVYGANDLDYTIVNTLNASLGPTSQTEFDAGGLEFEQLTLNADFTRRFEDLTTGAIAISFGGEYRDENYKITAGEPNSYINGGYRGVPNVNYVPEIGVNVPANFDPDDPSTFPDPFDSNFGISFAGGSQVFAGFTEQSAIDEGRNSIGVYVDVEWEPVDAWLLSGAMRYEDYSDFGSELTYKFSGRYDFSEQIALRGAISTGFRAPSLQQQFFTAISTNFIDGIPNEVGTFPATSDAAVALGGGQLDAETSDSYSIGLVFRPTDNFFITVDTYQINIDNQIFLSENLGGSEVDAVLAEAGVTGVNRVRFFQNGIETETQGVDIVSKYGFDLGDLGQLDLSAAFNYSDVEVTYVPSNPTIPTLTLFSRDRRLTFEESAPETKLLLAANWQYNKANLNLRGTQYGEVIDPSNNPENDFTLESKWIIDLSVDMDIPEQMNIGFGADNVFDQYPTQTPASQNFNGIFPYSSRSPFGFSGRFIYARVSYNW